MFVPGTRTSALRGREDIRVGARTIAVSREFIATPSVRNVHARASKVFPLGLTWRHGYAVSLGVQEPADLSEVAVPLDYVFDGGGFHQECVTAFPLDHSIHALDVTPRKYRRLR